MTYHDATSRQVPPALVVDREIDDRGHSSPVPLLHLINAVKNVPIGHAVALTSADVTSRIEVPAWIRRSNHALIGAFPDAGAIRFVVRRTH